MPVKAKDKPPELKRKVPLKTRRVPSDDFVVEVSGERYHPHAGEWVEVVALESTTGEIQSILGLNDYRAGRQNDSLALSRNIAQMHRALARRVMAWNWTDPTGRPFAPWTDLDEEGNPYAKLDGSTEPFEALEVRELFYLQAATAQEAPADQKNE